MSRSSLIYLLLALMLMALTLAGCEVKKDETLNSEVTAGAKSRDKAKDMQSETEKRNKAGEDVLNGK